MQDGRKVIGLEQAGAGSGYGDAGVNDTLPGLHSIEYFFTLQNPAIFLYRGLHLSY
jgi:hypothetical protein